MHEPYEARRFEREEKKGSVHYGWRSFVRALNENRTRGLPFRRRTLYPLSYKGVASFSRLGLTPETSCMSGTTNVESSVEEEIETKNAAAERRLWGSNPPFTVLQTVANSRLA